MRCVFGEFVEFLGKGASSIAVLIRMPDGGLAVEKQPVPGAESLFKAECLLLSVYRGVPGIIQALAVTDLDGRQALLLEYADGGDLRQRLQGRSTVRDARIVLRTILAALVTLHRNGHVHRDVKPENILIVRDRPCLADFSHAHGPKKSCGTLKGAGTPDYMAPELRRGDQGTAAADLFSLSIIIREMLLGTHPGDIRDVERARPDVDGQTRLLLKWMCEPEPTSRPTAEQALAVLDGRLVLADEQPDNTLPALFAVAAAIALVVLVSKAA